MSCWRRGPALTLALAVALQAGACELVLSDHRSGRELARQPLDPAAPTTRVAFTHSVLGTPVIDVYRWHADGDGRWVATLVEEQFDGEGYGLPHTAAPGERLVRLPQGWRLELSRRVDPLVVRPLPAQRMRLLLPGQADLLLGSLGSSSVHLQARACPEPRRTPP